MVSVDPIPDAPAALIHLPDQDVLAFADYHAGYESWLRLEHETYIDSRADSRRSRVFALVEKTAPDVVVIVGDLAHFFGGPHGAERGEVEVLLESLTDRLPVRLVKGNHDGGIEAVTDREPLASAPITITGPEGMTIDQVGFVHGHAWPAPGVLAADVICMGHEHPMVRLTDEVGGTRFEPVWLRGQLEREPFARRADDIDWTSSELVVFPPFNELLSGTAVNDDPAFLAPFLPAALPAADLYLLDGTKLGDFRSI